MHNIKDIRNNFEDFKRSIKDRNFDVNLDDIVELDKENRDLIQDKEKQIEPETLPADNKSEK